jgi:3-phosphoshikimate 1-carboxyvinyltransferase
MTAVGAALGLGPGSRVSGRFTPGGSKSLAQRALLFAAVARGRTRLTGLSAGADVDAALEVLASLGVLCERPDAHSAVLAGAPPGPAEGLVPAAPLAVGESGTLARLVTALVALASRPGERWTVAARGSLLFRKSTPLFTALRDAGVVVERQNLPGTWPVELLSVAPPSELLLANAVSSQEVSGLLVALAAHAGERALLVRGAIPSEPYLAMTRGLLAGFGARVTESAGEGSRRFLVRGPLVAPAAPLAIEPDASAAAVALAAACLSGGELRVPGLTPASLQGDVRIAAHLAAFGCETRCDAQGLFARGFPIGGAELELAGEPDLAPVLAAVAAGAALRHGATSELRGLGTLPGKESDRLGVLAEGLGALGFRATAGADALRIAPGTPVESAPHPLDPRGDHRMAFAFALLGLLVPGVLVHDAGCVAKSWSSFWSDLEGLGAVLQR